MWGGLCLGSFLNPKLSRAGLDSSSRVLGLRLSASLVGTQSESWSSRSRGPRPLRVARSVGHVRAPVVSGVAPLDPSGTGTPKVVRRSPKTDCDTSVPRVEESPRRGSQDRSRCRRRRGVSGWSAPVSSSVTTATPSRRTLEFSEPRSRGSRADCDVDGCFQSPPKSFPSVPSSRLDGWWWGRSRDGQGRGRWRSVRGPLSAGPAVRGK